MLINSIEKDYRSIGKERPKWWFCQEINNYSFIERIILKIWHIPNWPWWHLKDVSLSSTKVPKRVTPRRGWTHPKGCLKGVQEVRRLMGPDRGAQGSLSRGLARHHEPRPRQRRPRSSLRVIPLNIKIVLISHAHWFLPGISNQHSSGQLISSFLSAAFQEKQLRTTTQRFHRFPRGVQDLINKSSIHWRGWFLAYHLLYPIPIVPLRFSAFHLHSQPPLVIRIPKEGSNLVLYQVFVFKYQSL